MSKEMYEHLQELNKWIDQRGNIPKKSVGQSVEECKQLQAVNKAIEQLRRNGVPVPEDLRSLKLRLSANNLSGSENREIENQLKELEHLIESLGKILKSARSIREKLKATGHTAGLKKHYGVALLDLLQSGLISTDDKLELQWSKDSPKYEARVKPDGSIVAKGLGEWRQYDSLSTAASKIAGQSLNGWKHWRRVNSNGTSTALQDIRKGYMNEEVG